MNRINALAALTASAIFGASFWLSGYPGLLVNAIGITVVISGTLGAIFMSYSATDLFAALRVARNSYAVLPPTPEEVVESLMDVSMRQRQGGLLAIEPVEEQTTVTFLKNALSMLMDQYPERTFREILYTEMHFFQLRRQQHERIFHKMAQLAPSFGVAGSILGLIGMLGGIGDTTVIVQTIPIALTSTLYGVILANLILIPIAESIHSKTQKELLAQKIIVEGSVAIMQEEDSRRLARRLEAFMIPAARRESERTFAQIRARYLRSQGTQKRPRSHTVGIRSTPLHARAGIT
jgi:chemotaxis protein MotA